MNGKRNEAKWQGSHIKTAGKRSRPSSKRRVSEFKNSEEGRYTMCKAMERIAERNKAEGKRETMLATAKRMLKDGILALKDIARYSGLTLAQVKKLQASMA